ncbi:hypothetical protein J4E85_007111 [Alternaria conjuncta]|uniref:uncharacterized protein n=1 Tax=Alternaria conjuncta TaxID=181017 RepID=UPI00221E6653|nr:uncharacterized protein J4E85_007111 [Alternaria conjuncta]KAI4925234.1 hypothetical protein J4E85_007111 [Alternaria conjuncta]
MATPNRNRNRGRSFQRVDRAQSILSDSQASFHTPRPTPPPPPTRSGRGVRANSTVSDAPSSLLEQDTPGKSARKEAAAAKLSLHYHYAPTVPTPFAGTLEAGLDAIQVWGRVHSNLGTKGLHPLIDTLLRPVDSKTNWPAVFSALEDRPQGRFRYLCEELLFLITRTLLPEAIVQNRALMARLYDRKKQLAMRLVLRYDMLREWKMEHGATGREMPVAVASVPPTGIPAPDPVPHHVTALDDYLLLTDEEVAGLSGIALLERVWQVLLHWQWLRQNNEVLEEMEVHGWEELEGKADESEWIADDVKKSAAPGSKRAREKEDE